MKQTRRDYNHSEFSNNNQTTCFLWIREQHGGTQAEISTILSFPMTIKQLASCKLENNQVGHRDQHYSIFSKSESDHFLWMREQQRATDKQKRSTPFWIPKGKSDHLLSMNESDKKKQTSRDQHYSEFPNDNQITYILILNEWESNRVEGTSSD